MFMYVGVEAQVGDQIMTYADPLFVEVRGVDKDGNEVPSTTASSSEAVKPRLDDEASMSIVD